MVHYVLQTRARRIDAGSSAAAAEIICLVASTVRQLSQIDVDGLLQEFKRVVRGKWYLQPQQGGRRPRLGNLPAQSTPSPEQPENPPADWSIPLQGTKFNVKVRRCGGSPDSVVWKPCNTAVNSLSPEDLLFYGAATNGMWNNGLLDNLIHSATKLMPGKVAIHILQPCKGSPGQLADHLWTSRVFTHNIPGKKREAGIWTWEEFSEQPSEHWYVLHDGTHYMPLVPTTDTTGKQCYKAQDVPADGNCLFHTLVTLANRMEHRFGGFSDHSRQVAWLRLQTAGIHKSTAELYDADYKEWNPLRRSLAAQVCQNPTIDCQFIEEAVVQVPSKSPAGFLSKDKLSGIAATCQLPGPEKTEAIHLCHARMTELEGCNPKDKNAWNPNHKAEWEQKRSQILEILN